MTRCRFALALGVVLLGCSGGVAAAAENASQLVTATVYGSGGATTTDSISLGALEANSQNCPEYSGKLELHGQGGSQGLSEGLQQTTWALSTVLGCLHVPVQTSAVHGIIVVSTNGSPEVSNGSQLNQNDLTTPSPFADSSELPVISSDGSNIIYNRPWRGGTDDNLVDQVIVSNPSPFTIEVFEGPILTVNATASQTTVPAGTTVSFSATVTGAGDFPLTYSWKFSDGASDSTAPAPQVTFRTPGQWEVTVQVTDADGGGGGATIPITVGSAPSGSGPTQQGGPGTHTTPRSPASGPTTSGGTHPGGPSGKPVSQQPTSSGKGRGTKPPASGTRQRRSTPAPHAAATTTTPGSTGAAGGAGSSSAAGAHRTAGAERHVARIKTPSPSTNSIAAAPLVTGRLISDVTPLPPGASPLVHYVTAAPATAPGVRRAIAASIVPVLAGALTVFLLLSLGAARELRGRRDWRALLPGS